MAIGPERKPILIDCMNVVMCQVVAESKPAYHQKHGTRALKELGRSYLTLTQDVTRVMNRIKGVFRGWAIPRAGTKVYSPRHRGQWLAQLVEPGVRIRAEHVPAPG